MCKALGWVGVGVKPIRACIYIIHLVSKEQKNSESKVDHDGHFFYNHPERGAYSAA